MSSEAENRWQKAVKYAAHFRAFGMLSGDIAKMDCNNPFWKPLAVSLGIEPPHSQATIICIVWCLQRHEEAAAAYVSAMAAQPFDFRF